MARTVGGNVDAHSGEKRGASDALTEAHDGHEHSPAPKREKYNQSFTSAALSLGFLPTTSTASSSSPPTATSTASATATPNTSNGFLGLPFMLPNAALAAMNGSLPTGSEAEELSSALHAAAASSAIEKTTQDANDAEASAGASATTAAAASSAIGPTQGAIVSEHDSKDVNGAAALAQVQKAQIQQLQLLQQQFQSMNPSDLAAMATIVAQQMALGMMMMPAMLPLMNNPNGSGSNPPAVSMPPFASAPPGNVAGVSPAALAALQAAASMPPATGTEDSTAATSSSTHSDTGTTGANDATSSSQQATAALTASLGTSAEALNAFAAANMNAASSPMQLLSSPFPPAAHSSEDEDAARRKRSQTSSPLETTATGTVSSSNSTSTVNTPSAAASAVLKDAEKMLKQFPMWNYGMPMPFLPGFPAMAVPPGSLAGGSPDASGLSLPSTEDQGLKDDDSMHAANGDGASLDKAGRSRAGKAPAKKKSRGTGKPRGRPRTRPRPGEVIRRVKPPPIAPANYSMMYNYSLANLAQKSMEMNDATGMGSTGGNGTGSTNGDHDDPRLSTSALLPMDQE